MSALRGDRGWRLHRPSSPTAAVSTKPGPSHVERDAMGHNASRMREEARKAWRRATWNWHKQRRRDLDAIFRARYGGEGIRIPPGAEMVAAARVMAFHMKAEGGPDRLVVRLAEWIDSQWPCGLRTEGEEPDPEEIAAEVAGRRLDLSAARCGAILRLTWEERCRLGIRTIRNHDMTPAEFHAAVHERKLALGRERDAARRRRQGRATREAYRWQGDQEPWLYLGVSRSTWDRRKKAGRLGDLVAACTIDVPDWLAAFCRRHDAGHIAEAGVRPARAAPNIVAPVAPVAAQRDESERRIAEGSPAVGSLSSPAQSRPSAQVGAVKKDAVVRGHAADAAPFRSRTLARIAALLAGGTATRLGAPCAPSNDHRQPHGVAA